MLDFVKESVIINGSNTRHFQFFTHGFWIRPLPSYIDVVVSGATSLTLTNAIELNYLKLFGGTEQVPETYLDTVTLDGGCEQRNLPNGFTQLEYLESTGTQYIDTGVVLKSEATITTVGQNVQSNVTSGPYSFWGFMGDDTIPRWGWSIYQNKWLANLNATTTSSTAVVTNKYTFKNVCYYENNVLKYDSLLDGNAIISGKTADSPALYTSNTLSAYLFARNNSGTAGNFLSCRIFSYEIVQDGILACNLIPARRNSDSVLGMYDTVTGNFLTNAGTGTFTAGADTVPTPDYPMDIWCNNGAIKVSPNLFNKDLVPDANEYISKGNGNATSPVSGEFRHSDYIVIKENTQYYVGIINSTANSAGLAFYDDTKTYISGISLTQLGDDDNIITSPNNTKYIRFSFRIDEGYNTNWQNTVYFVEGNQPLAEFMPYGAIYTDGTVEQVTDSLGNTANAEMLLKVGNYKDTQEVISGSVTRNVGIKVLDGTENWQIGQNSIYVYNLLSYANVAENTPYCTHYKGTRGDASAMDYQNSNSIRLYSAGANRINVFAVMNDYPTVDTFKQWLADEYQAGHPVIIVYPTSSATTETVTGQFLSKSPVTQTAGSIDNLPITITESEKTVPTPQQPLDIVSNNGVLKYNSNIIDNTITEQGTFVSPSSQATRIYKYFGKLQSGNYTLSITGGFQFIVQYRDTDPPTTSMTYGNIGTWATSGTYALDNPDYFYGIAIRYPDNSDITPSDFNGTITLKPQFVYTDGTTETVQVTGKNLFDGVWQVGIYSTTTGDYTPTNNHICNVNMIQVEPSTSYTVSCPSYALENGMRWVFYDTNKNFISAITNGATTITTPSNAKYINFYIANNLTVDTAPDLQLEEGSTATDYEPYYNGGQATAEMLLKIGDYQDVQSILDGGVTRNVGIKVFDGTETWAYESQYSRFNTELMPPSIIQSAIRTIPAHCTHFEMLSNGESIASITSGQGYIMRSAQSTKLYLHSDITSLENFAQYLADQYNAGTPVIVVYPLATATTETVTGQPLTVQQGTNIVTITQASIDGLEMEVSYKQQQ